MSGFVYLASAVCLLALMWFAHYSVAKRLGPKAVAWMVVGVQIISVTWEHYS